MTRYLIPFLLLTWLLLPPGIGPAHGQSGAAERKPFKFQSADNLKRKLENPERIKKQQPDRVYAALGVSKGESVADIGAGTGFHAFRLADKVGATGKVYAVEIQDELLAFMGDRIREKGLTNIELVKSSPADPELAPRSCDKILVANTYYYLPAPVKFMGKLRQALKPRGRLALIDLDAAKAPMVRQKILTAREVIAEMEQAGFKLVEAFDFLDSRFFLVFTAGE